MWIGVILICASPVDATSCDVLVRTSGGVFSQDTCIAQVKDDLSNMNVQNVYTRYKCFEMQGSV